MHRDHSADRSAERAGKAGRSWPGRRLLFAVSIALLSGCVYAPDYVIDEFRLESPTSTIEGQQSVDSRRD